MRAIIVNIFKYKLIIDKNETVNSGVVFNAYDLSKAHTRLQ